MKIRLRGQSVRLRLGKSEVARLARGEAIEETTDFGQDARFGCVLLRDARTTCVRHAYDAGRLIVRVPASTVDVWAGGDAVGFSAELPTDGRTLALLVEKDFVCIDNAGGEPQDDAFPNPAQHC